MKRPNKKTQKLEKLEKLEKLVAKEQRDLNKFLKKLFG
jgi:hypothetical protein